MTWRIPKQRIWPTIIIAVLVIDVGVGVVMMRIANRDANFAIEPDYYSKAIAWDSTTAQARRNVVLGWQLTPELGALSGKGNSTLTMALRDRAGAPVTGARVEVEAIPVAHAGEALHSELQAAPIDGDYAAALPMTRTGLWELRVTATRGGDRYTADLRLDTSTSAPASAVAGRPWDPDPRRVSAGMRPDAMRRAPDR
jgi:nitrogen fixation protein FixH